MVGKGRRLEDDILQLSTFDDAGKAMALRQYVDTAKHIAAAR